MNHPSEPCACEMGADKCTPVGLCAAQEMVEDQTQQLRDEIEQLRKIKAAAEVLWRHHVLTEGGIVPGDSVSWRQLEEALMTGDSSDG